MESGLLLATNFGGNGLNTEKAMEWHALLLDCADVDKRSAIYPLFFAEVSQGLLELEAF